MHVIDTSLMLRAISSAAEGFTLTDPHQPDNPLIFVNDSFSHMTGYSTMEMIGRNCRFLQGKKTNSDAVERMRESIHHQKSCAVEVLNYRKNGSTFWNRVSLSPVFDIHHKLRYFIGIHSDMTLARQLLAEREAHLTMLQTHLQDMNRTLHHLSSDVQSSLRALHEAIEHYSVHGNQEDTETSHATLRSSFSSLLTHITLLATLLETNSSDIMNYISTQSPDRNAT